MSESWRRYQMHLTQRVEWKIRTITDRFHLENFDVPVPDYDVWYDHKRGVFVSNYALKVACAEEK